MHKLLAHQLRSHTGADGALDVDALLAAVRRTYDEFDRERRLNDRSNRLMEEELKEANERIRRHGERRLAETLDNAPCALALLDAALKVQTANAQMLALCDAADEAMLCDLPLIELIARISPGTDDAARSLLEARPVEFECRGRWYLGAAARLSLGGYALSFADITALKEREAALALAKDAAESASRLKSQFLAVMSHELRTPLNAILGFSEVIRDTVLGTREAAWTRYSDYAASIHDSGRHLLSLISEILDLSRIESGSYRLVIDRCDIGDVIADAVGLVDGDARKGNVRIAPVALPPDMTAMADRRAVKQVLLNLISNAVKFTQPGGDISLAVDADDSAIRIAVRDTGIGIAPDHLEQVFEPFHQGDAQVSRRYQGTGLGLPISRALAEMHGGTLVLASELGIGTVATMTLPRVAAAPSVTKAA